jgi:hypothetical protein
MTETEIYKAIGELAKVLNAEATIYPIDEAKKMAAKQIIALLNRLNRYAVS